MRTHTLATSVAAALVLLGLSGCGPKRLSGGATDDPRTHADRGRQYYDAGDGIRSRQEYVLALELDKKCPQALAGLAMLEAREGRFDEAEKDVKASVGQDDKIPDGWMAWGVAIGEKNRAKDTDGWLSEAEGAFEKALRRGDKNPEVWYRLALVRQWALHFREAGDAYRKILDLDRGFTGPANEGWIRLQKIERAAPGTRYGKKIALLDSLSRADAAVLVIEELQMDKLLSRTRSASDTSFQVPSTAKDAKTSDAKPVANDISGHWARNFVTDALALGMRGLQLGPDGSFRPAQALNRAEFSLLAEDALIAALGDKSLATRYIGNTPRFSDVPGGSPYFNAICDAVDHSVMSPNPDGSFGALKPVSGADALLTVRMIKELRK